jgi:coenzyme F420-0:L-glutamate ligase
LIGGVPGFLLTSRDGLLTPNAGIDKSNIIHGTVVLYPRRPEVVAERIRESVRFALGVSIGVVVCDSRLSPTRRGTTGVALAASGLEAILDLRGKEDLFGNVLKVTSQGIADDLSSAAELLMGESDEGTPMVVLRGLRKELLRETEYPPRRFSIPRDQCVYLRSLGHIRR